MINRQVVTQGDLLRLDRTHWMMRDLVGWWPMQEGAGETVFDLSSYSRSGSFVNLSQSSDWVVGRGGGHAVNFNPLSSEHISIPHTDVITGTSDFSISVWFRTTYSSWHYLVAQGGDVNSANEGVGIALNDGALYGFISDGSRYVFPSVGSGYNDGKWHHCLYTFDRSAYCSAYIDGEYIGQWDISARSGDIAPDDDLFIGAYGYPSGGYFSGDIQDARVFRRVLTTSEISELYLNPWAPLSKKSKTLLTASAAGIIYNQRQILLKNKMSIQNSRLLIGK